MAKIKSSLKRLFRLKFTFPGLFLGGLFAILSFTPSLLPRTWFFQGVLSGVTFVFGYGIGNAIGAIYRYFQLPEPSQHTKAAVKRVSAIIGVLFFIIILTRYVDWNSSLYRTVGMDIPASGHYIGIIMVALLIAYIILVVSRALRGFVRVTIRYSLRVLPVRLAKLTGAVVGTVLLIMIFNGFLFDIVMSGVNTAFSARDTSTDIGITQPESPFRSGSEQSLVAWEDLGRQGRNFTGSGPTVNELNDVSGGGAMQPIRAYVGLKSAPTVEKRAELALEELIRMNAFDRKVLVVATTTGTGWLDPGAVDSVEYVHNGDTAIVGLQYSYLPSWISLFVDQQITLDTARQTLFEIHDYWSTLDEDTRPELYLFGLSLGAYGSQNSATSIHLINDPIDGGLFTGSPFVSDHWAALTNNRDAGSPAWRPIFDEGRVIRFTGEENALNKPQAEWGDIKFVYFQHATDPIVFFSPGLLVNSPDWLIEGQRGPGISPDMTWIPGVTFWQVAADMPMAGGVPNGNGHAYSPGGYVNAWAAITEANDLDKQKAEDIVSAISENN